jgi:VanZ family protein
MKILMLLVVALIVAATIAANTGNGGWIFAYIGLLPGKDLTGHFLLYGLLGFSVVGFLNQNGRRSTRTVFTWIFIVGCLVAAEEFSQSFVPSRTFSMLDLMASLAGLLVGSVVQFGTQLFFYKKTLSE